MAHFLASVGGKIVVDTRPWYSPFILDKERGDRATNKRPRAEKPPKMPHTPSGSAKLSDENLFWGNFLASVGGKIVVGI